MKIVTIAMALLIALPATAQRSKSKTDNITMVMPSGGIVYSLPRTGIRIKITATRTNFVSGPYAAYAESLLGIRNVKQQPGISWNIEKVEFSSFSEPDPEHRYRTGAGQSAMLQLTPEGCLAGINTNLAPPKTEPPVSNSYNYRNLTNELMFTNLTNSTEMTGRSPVEQRATSAAALILKSRSTRFDIASGMLDEFHPDGDAYDESIEELRKIEKTNLELFTGKSVTDEYTFFYDFVPPAKSVKGEVIFRFDETLGFLPKTDFSGKPVMIDVEKSGTSPSPGTQVAPSPANTAAVFYRLPGMATVTLTRELTLIGTTRMPLAQFGQVETLPAELLNGQFAIEFHPETGSLRSVIKK
ncbi:MAG TPA: DUF4831 family protein [Prolixibacteraceae bacterium]|nr:DUF4831 family protein [Prolixibacteraceae bacterium]HOS89765.1 DUF4831 family protein [Prolixibacteraceae bacterium]HPL44767.1 DUF4831 family protein [Prolixibacteraceae bacterium]HQE51314.1 DUF4831 family protein [Prolixibacteraceae bacterium]HQH75675.1 DUF4831 family protein [Prolixibacteraceae bacterium]